MRELEKAKGPLDKKALQQIKNDKQKELAQLKKDIKQYNKIQKETDQLQHDNEELNQHLNELRQPLKPLDELKQEVEELKHKIKEDSQLMADENASLPERMIANVRLLENEAELERANTEIAAREKPLLERLKISLGSTDGPCRLWLLPSALFLGH